MDKPNEVICEIRKRQQRNPMFGHIGDGISKNKEKKYIEFQQGLKFNLIANLLLN